MEPRRMFLDVRFDRHELLLDERRRLAVAVRLGFQPSAGPSRRRGAEIEQHPAVLLFRGGTRRCGVSTPVDGHTHLLRTRDDVPVHVHPRALTAAAARRRFTTPVEDRAARASQARAFPYSASRRLHAFSAWGSL